MSNFLFDITHKDLVAVYKLDQYSYDTMLRTNPEIRIAGSWPLSEKRIKTITNDSVRQYDSLKNFCQPDSNEEEPNVIILLLRETKLIKKPFNMIYSHKNILKLYEEINVTKYGVKKVYVVCGKVFSQTIYNILNVYAQMQSLNTCFVPYFDSRFLLEENEKFDWVGTRPDFFLVEELHKRNAQGKTILDIGAGRGAISAYLADMGLLVTATDIVPYAFSKCNERKGLRFIVDDMIHTKLTEKFDFILDRFTFHNYVKYEEQKQYIENLSRLLSDQGVLFIYFRSEYNEHDEVENPYYYSREAVYELFKKQFVILSCEEFELYNDEKEFIFNAFFCIMRKNMVVIK